MVTQDINSCLNYGDESHLWSLQFSTTIISLWHSDHSDLNPIVEGLTGKSYVVVQSKWQTHEEVWLNCSWLHLKGNSFFKSYPFNSMWIHDSSWRNTRGSCMNSCDFLTTVMHASNFCDQFIVNLLCYKITTISFMCMVKWHTLCTHRPLF